MSDILIYGVISKDEYSAAFVNYMLAQTEGDSVKVRLNSPGGSVIEAEAIYALLKSSGKKVSVHVDGIAASAAMHLYMKFEDRFIFPDASVMVHRVSNTVTGDYEKVRNSADYLEKVNDIYKARIASVFGISDDEADTLMKNETWFTGQELIEKGIALTDPNESQVDRVAAKATINEFSETLKSFNNTPGKLIADNKTTGEKMKAELAKLFSLDAEAKESVFLEKVQSLQSRAELVSGLESKVDSMKAELTQKQTALAEMQAKLATFEVEQVKASILKEQGVELAQDNIEAFNRRVKRYLESTDETVRADLRADLTTFAKLNGIPVGQDPNLSGNGNDRKDGNAEEQLHARAVNIQAEARKQGKEMDYRQAIKLATEAK